MKGPLVLALLDGWGYSEDLEYNAVERASSYYKSLREEWPRTLLSCSGNEVGLPLGLMGNSEVGHMNLGAGRIIWQDITRIDRSIRDGTFFENGALLGPVRRARRLESQLHLMGLLSDGGVHSSYDHLLALLKLATKEGLRREQVVVHAFLDGRDTPPTSGREFVARLERDMADIGVGHIATLIGRYYAMDRDRRWERTKIAYDALMVGVGRRADTALAGIEAAYARGKTDEFVEPVLIGNPMEGRVLDDDGLLFFNFRADRARQLTEALVSSSFGGFMRAHWPSVELATMTRYRDDFQVPTAFPPQALVGIFPEIIAARGARQLRIAETEKYAHVTYFFSGGRERPFDGEERILVPSPKVATYDLKPEMSAIEVTEKLLEAIRAEAFDFIMVNYANADMVGHTGKLEAAERAVRAVDQCLSKLVPAVMKRQGVIAITADHGNAELMWDRARNEPHTAHTTNPVELLLVGEAVRGARLRELGILADVAPTFMQIAGWEKPEAMDGRSLLEAR